MKKPARGLSACLLTLLFVSATPAAAQQAGHSGHQARGHAETQAREFSNLQQGRGMDMARAAENNRYPGPMHVLEHAEALELSDDQIERSRELMSRVKTRAPELGRQIVDGEKRLEAMFAEGSVEPSSMDSLLMEIAELRAQLRSIHLTAHLDQAAILTEAQITKYMELRAAASTEQARRPMRRLHDMQRPGKSHEDNG